MNKLILLLIFGSGIIGRDNGFRFAEAIFRISEKGSDDFEFDQVQSHFNNAIETSRSLLTRKEVLESLDICGGFDLIADQIPDGKRSCICQNSRVDCTLEGQCSVDRSVCTDTVSISFQFQVNNDEVTRMRLSSCFTYTEEFDTTCIDTFIGRGQTLESCNRATYGGKNCLCAVCGDNKSLALDCSTHHPVATSNGCYLLSDALPVLTKFDEPPQRPEGRRVEETSDAVAPGTLKVLMSLFVTSIAFAFL